MKNVLIVFVLFAAGCCSHGDAAREGMRINAHLADTATTAEGRAIATANYRVFAGIAGVTSEGGN